MSKTKEIHQYNGTSWGQAIPIGADASNVDVMTQEGTQVPLQDVLGTPSALEPSIKTQINSKVDAEGGDVAHTVVNNQTTPIIVYDLDDEEDSEELISNDLSTDRDVVVMSGDGENLTTMWSKFNRFRKRVDNKFKKFLVDSVAGVTPGASSDKKGYSTQALNNYFSSVIGYTSAADVSQTGSIASQLSSLNNKSAGYNWNRTIIQCQAQNLVNLQKVESLSVNKIGAVGIVTFNAINGNTNIPVGTNCTFTFTPILSFTVQSKGVGFSGSTAGICSIVPAATSQTMYIRITGAPFIKNYNIVCQLVCLFNN